MANWGIHRCNSFVSNNVNQENANGNGRRKKAAWSENKMSGKGQCKGESRLRRGGNVDRNAENAQKEKEAE